MLLTHIVNLWVSLQFLYYCDGNNVNETKRLLWNDNVYVSAKHHCMVTSSKRGYTDMVNLLLTDERMKPSVDMVLFALSNGHVDIVNHILVDGRVNISQYVADTILTRACKNNWIDIIKLLLSNDYTTTTRGKYIALRWSCFYGQVDIVKMLIEQGHVSPDVNILVDAIYANRIDIVLLILMKGHVDPSAEDNKAVKIALKLGRTQIAKLLVMDSRVIPKKEFSKIVSDIINTQ